MTAMPAHFGVHAIPTVFVCKHLIWLMILLMRFEQWHTAGVFISRKRTEGTKAVAEGIIVISIYI